MMRTELLLHRFVALCSAFPNSKCLLITHAKPVQVAYCLLGIQSEVKYSYDAVSGTITFPNESRIIVNHWKGEKDSDLYLALEWDVIEVDGIELDEHQKRALSTRLRSYSDGSRIPAPCSDEMTAEGQRRISLIERMLAIVKEVAAEIAQNPGASS